MINSPILLQWRTHQPPDGAVVWVDMLWHCGLWHRHLAPGHFNLQVLLGGEICCRHEMHTTILRPGSVSLLWPDCQVSLEPHSRKEIEMYRLRFVGAGCENLFRRLGFSSRAFTRMLGDPAATRTVLVEMMNLYTQKKPQNIDLALSLIYRLAYTVQRLSPGEPQAASGHRVNAELIVETLKAFHSQPIGVAEIARWLRVSGSTLRRTIHDAGKPSPLQELTRLRIEHAKHLLETTDRTAVEIATACGFASDKYFITRFRRCTGLSPGAYRARQACER